MSIKGVSKSIQSMVHEPIAKVSKGTKRFGDKLEGKITGLFNNSRKKTGTVDHSKFVAQEGIAKDSPEVEALRQKLLNSQG